MYLQETLMNMPNQSTRRASSPATVYHNHLLSTACWVSVPIFAATLLLLGLSSGYALGQRTETFTGGFGSWTTTYGLTDSGFNLGWANTANAGGAPGEIGGLIVQTNSTASPPNLGMPHILDTVSFAGGNTLTLNSPLSASGQMYLSDPGTANMNVFIGYFNSADPTAQRLAIRFDSPGTHTPSPIWRVRMGGPNATGTRTSVPDGTWNATPLSFDFTWTPSGLNDGSGTLAGELKNGATVFTVTPQSVAANSVVLNSFGMWVDSAGSTVPANVQTEWFDNITYTIVPEPSAALLWPLAGGFLLLARRNLRRA
jgi:hypothetical protein